MSSRASEISALPIPERPVGLVYGDRVQLANLWIDRVPAGAYPGEPDYFPKTLGNPPSMRDGQGEIAAPAFGELCCHGPVGTRQQCAEARIPRVDVDARNASVSAVVADRIDVGGCGAVCCFNWTPPIAIRYRVCCQSAFRAWQASD